MSISVQHDILLSKLILWVSLWVEIMAKLVNRLIPNSIKNSMAPGLYPDGDGLYLQVSKAGSKSWLFRFMLRGKARHMGMGSFRDKTLKEARSEAGVYRGLLDKGIDPIEYRKTQREAQRQDEGKAKTFKECAEAYIELRKPDWKNSKHADQWTNTLDTYTYPIIGNRPVADIDSNDVLKVLKPIWYKKSETATRVRQRIESVLNYARVRGYRNGENPALWRGHLDQVLPKRNKVKTVKHHPALPYQELPDLFADLMDRKTAAAKALAFTILTAVRSGECRKAVPTEFDLNAGVWIIPSKRMKAHREHRVPLTKTALQLVSEALKDREEPDFVFPGIRKDTPLSENAMLTVLKKSMKRPDLTVHGFRSTFRDWAGECTNFPREVIEAALAHQIKNQTEKAYARGDLFEKRQKLMEAWANYCLSTKKGSVIPFKKKQAG